MLSLASWWSTRTRHVARLAAVCKLLDHDTHQLNTRMGQIPGDKEMYWIGFAIVEDAYVYANDYKTGLLGVSTMGSD